MFEPTTQFSINKTNFLTCEQLVDIEFGCNNCNFTKLFDGYGIGKKNLFKKIPIIQIFSYSIGAFDVSKL